MPIRNLKVHMPTTYGSSYEDMGKKVKDKYPNGTYQTKLQWAWLRLKNVMSVAQFENLWATHAELMDVAWMYEAPNNLINGYQNTYSQAILPNGRFLQNYLTNIPRGGMIGDSSFAYAGNGSDQGQVATEFVMDDAGWMMPGERRMCVTPNADRTDNFAYNESFLLAGVRLTMPTAPKDGITRVGWYIKRAGSTSYGNQLQANGGSKGFVFIDGVPAVFGTIRAFYSEVAGASFEGTWGADITIAKLECDAATRPFQVINTADGNGGGVIRIGLKIEDGVSAGIPAPGSYCYIEGQYDIEVSMNASFANGAKPAGGHLFVVNPVISGGNAQGSRLQVSGKGFGYVGILKNQATGKTWAGAGDYQAFSFEHYANGDKLFTNCPTLAGGTPPTTPTDPTTPTNPTGPYVDRSLWVISAYNTAPADNFGTHEASKMKDGNTNTWWHSGKPQSATGTDYVPVVFNAPTAIKGIVMDLPDNDFPNDYPDGLVVQVMVNGLWKAVENPVATYGKKTTVSFKSVVAQRFRFATNKAKGPWLCIAELNAIAG